MPSDYWAKERNCWLCIIARRPCTDCGRVHGGCPIHDTVRG